MEPQVDEGSAATNVTVAAVSEIRNKTDLEFSGTIFEIRNATKLKLVE